MSTIIWEYTIFNSTSRSQKNIGFFLIRLISTKIYESYSAARKGTRLHLIRLVSSSENFLGCTRLLWNCTRLQSVFTFFQKKYSACSYSADKAAEKKKQVKNASLIKKNLCKKISWRFATKKSVKNFNSVSKTLKTHNFQKLKPFSSISSIYIISRYEQFFEFTLQFFLDYIDIISWLTLSTLFLCFLSNFWFSF